MEKSVVVIPTYNSKRSIIKLIKEIFKYVPEGKIIVVDDNSPDGTANTVKELQKTFTNLHLIQGKKEGLGRAYLRGFMYAIDNLKADLIFEMDADGSHDPHLIPQFLYKIDEGADFVIGSRYIPGGSIPANWQPHRKIFSFIGNLIIRIGFMDLSHHEWTNGNRAIKAEFIKKIMNHLSNYNGYVFQIAILDKARKNHLNIVEIPQNFKDREFGSSKIDSLQYIYDILQYVFQHSSFIKFCIVGFIGFMINAIGLEVFYRYGFSASVAAAIGAEFSIISNFLLNNFWSFSHKKIAHKKHYIPQFIRFNTISLGSVAIQFVVVGVGTHFFGDSKRLIFLIVAVVFFIVPYSYFMYNKFVWGKKHIQA